MEKSVLCILLTLFFVTCSKEKEIEVETKLELSESEITFLAIEETKYFSIESNSSWDIQDTPDWITLNTTKGSGNKQVSIKASTNSKEENRSVLLNIVSGNKKKSINITQLAKNVTLALSKNILEFPAERIDDGLTFDITSNEEWSIEDIPEWCNINKKNGENNATITTILEQNYIDLERTAVLNIKAGSQSQKLEIKQKALNIELAFLSDDLNFWSETAQLKMSSKTDIVTITIKSNTKWKIQNDIFSWYKIDKLEGINNNQITISVSENNEKSSRKDDLIIKAGSKSITLSILQAGSELTGNQNQISIENNAPRIGDHLVKKMVEYIEPGNDGENQHWNFNSLTSYNDNFEVTYSAPPIADGKYIMMGNKFEINEASQKSLIVASENYTSHYFRIKDNILEELGYENPTNSVNYYPNLNSVVYSSGYKAPLKQAYKADNYYSGTIHVKWEGYTEIQTDGFGTITLPCGTYENVIRTKKIQTIKLLDGNYTADTTTINTYITYSWYLRGYRYPVFEIHNSSSNLNGYTPISSFGIYFSPKDHSYLNNSSQLILLNPKTM